MKVKTTATISNRRKVIDNVLQDIDLQHGRNLEKEGRVVPTASPYVSFNANGLGKIVGTGSDNTDHNPVYETSRKMYAGRITVAVQVGRVEGDLKVYANAENLKCGVLTIPLSKE